MTEQRPGYGTGSITEKALQRAVEQLLRAFRWRVYHTWNSMHSAAGFPDIIAVRGKRLLAIELKSERGRLTAEQQAWLDALQEAGVETCVVRPSDWDRLVETVR